MSRRDALHLDLIFAVLRIDVIELFLACGTLIRNSCGVQRLGNPDDRKLLGDSQPQIVERVPSGLRAFLKGIVADCNNRSKVKVVPDTAWLVVDARLSDGIGVHPTGTGVAHDLYHARKHVPAGIDVDAGIAEERNSGFRVINSGRVQTPSLTRGPAMPQACPISA